MWRELGRSLRIGLDLAREAGDSDWPRTRFGTRGTVHEWSSLEDGLDRAMGPEQEWIDAAVYGLPWRVHSEFAEEQLSAVAMAHYRGLARERPFKRYEGFDNALLALSAEELFAELASRIAAAYGPPSEIDGLQRWAWNTACVRIALERGTPQALADVYLWLRPGGG